MKSGKIILPDFILSEPNTADLNMPTIEICDAHLIITFNCPKERNPLSVAVLEKLHKILDDAAENYLIEKIIFTGSGNVFASGANLREIAEVSSDTAREFAERGQRVMKKIADNSKLTIAAVNGFCFGGALDLALSCNKRFALPKAIFCHPGANLGIITGWGGTQRLPRLIGEANALEMFLTAKQVSADEALGIGLIDAICENPLEKAVAYKPDFGTS